MQAVSHQHLLELIEDANAETGVLWNQPPREYVEAASGETTQPDSI
jgi:hypothetical protein